MFILPHMNQCFSNPFHLTHGKQQVNPSPFSNGFRCILAVSRNNVLIETTPWMARTRIELNIALVQVEEGKEEEVG